MLELRKISTREAWKIRGILAASAGFLFVSWQMSPMRILHTFFPDLFIFKEKETLCVLLNSTGLPCPFCGMTRSFNSLLNFDLAGVFYFNPSSVIFFTFISVITLAIFVLSLFNFKIHFHNSRTVSIFLISFISLIWVLNIFFGHH
jgi:hypothetical protein